MSEFCSQANQGCRAPAGYGVGGGGGAYLCEAGRDPTARATCFCCGQPVCGNKDCSKRVSYRGKRSRLCSSCIEMMAVNYVQWRKAYQG